MEPAVDRVAGVRPLAAGEFDEIRRLARRTFGLDLKPGKEQLVAARLGRMMRGGGFHSYQQLYRHIVADSTGESLAALVDALATNHTAFLREPDHFTFLRERALPALRGRSRVDVWCAACSTGEEAWTLACLLNDFFPAGGFRITATDISRKALAAAQRAVYPAARCAALPEAWLSRYFMPEAGGEAFQVRPAMRAKAAFSKLNLMEPVSWPRQFPVIFCRNVMIYFDADAQELAAGKLAASLEPGGYLFIGHAESLSRFPQWFEYVRPAVYRKPDKQGGGWNKSL